MSEKYSCMECASCISTRVGTDGGPYVTCWEVNSTVPMVSVDSECPDYRPSPLTRIATALEAMLESDSCGCIDCDCEESLD